MLKILLESLLLECAENGMNANKEIDHLYETLNNNFTTDLQKEIKDNGVGIQELKLMAYDIINSDEFKEELKDLNIEIDVKEEKEEKENKVEKVYNEIVNELMANDSNATYDEILSECAYNYNESINILSDIIRELKEEYEDDEEIFNFYNSLYKKILLVIR